MEPPNIQWLNPEDYLRIPDAPMMMNLMTEWKFFDKKDGSEIFFMLGGREPKTELPKKVAKIEINGEGYSLPSVDCMELAGLLDQSSKKLDHISITNVADGSPEYLALLISICNNSKIATFTNCLHGDHNFGCLSASLLKRDGLKRLEIRTRWIHDPLSNATLLLDAIAVSPCLQSLKICLDAHGSNDEVERRLVSSLRRNSRIKDLDIELTASTLSPEFFRATIAERETHSLKLLLPENHHASVDDLAAALSRSDCSLRKLHVEGDLTNWFENTDHGPVRIADKNNKSVKDLLFTKTQLPVPQLVKVINMFESLVSLDLASNNLSDLSFLDPLLLLGEQQQQEGSLQSLSLRENEIDWNEFKTFISKIPRMKCLRNLELQGNPFTFSETYDRAAIEEAFWQNTSLERFTYVYSGTAKFTKKDLAFSLNKCGRGKLQNHTLPASLWPLVLQRTQTISLVPFKDKWGQPSTRIGPDALKVEALYWLIREQAVHSWGFSCR